MKRTLSSFRRLLNPLPLRFLSGGRTARRRPSNRASLSIEILEDRVTPSLTGNANNIYTTAGSYYQGTVGNVYESDPNASVWATNMNWGDGNSDTPQNIWGSGGNYKIADGHTYTQAGTYPVSLTVQDSDGNWLTLYATAHVADAPISASGNGFSTTAGQTYLGPVATFTDGNSYSQASDFTATVTWGDGNSDSNVQITGTGNGPYTVTDSHTYTQSGVYPVSVTITDTGGSTATAYGNASVNDAPFYANATWFNTTAGQFYTGTVATFQDQNTFATAGDFSAQVNWGDGASDNNAQIVSYGNGSFGISDGHTYTQAGSYPVSVTITDVAGNSATAYGNASVNDASLWANGTSITTTAGQLYTGNVATFQDGNPYLTAGDFSTQVNWGDGTWDNNAQIVSYGNGSFGVSDGHVYASPGSYSISVTITDIAGSSATAYSNATVSSMSSYLSGSGGNISTTAGTTWSGTVGGVYDSDPNAMVWATIYWGDGSSDSPMVSGSMGNYHLTDSHTYTQAGVYTLTLTVQDSDGSSTTLYGTATVADASIWASGTYFSTTAGQTYQGPVATFTDGNSYLTAGDFSAQVTWGDNTSDNNAQIVSYGDGSFGVSDGHTYTQTGQYSVSVTITDIAGGSATAYGTATVADASIWASGTNFSTTAGQTYQGPVATFTDGNTYSQSSDFTATVNWGDGTSDGNVQISGTGSGPYTVDDSHTYTQAGQYSVTVTITDIAGSSATAYSNASVSSMSSYLSGSGGNISTTAGTTWSGTVGSVYDSDPNAMVWATIYWGDGSSDSPMVSGSMGNYHLTDSHTYTQAGVYPLTITVQDSDGSSTALYGTATVAGDTIWASGINFSTTAGQTYQGPVATFTDGNSYSQASDFAATVNWGDGTSDSNVQINTGAGLNYPIYTISDGHIYTAPGQYAVTVTIQDNDGGTATAYGNATVADAAIQAAIGWINTTEGQLYTGTVATFQDSNLYLSAGDFSAQVNWGDGTSDNNAQIVSSGGGYYSVVDSHIYTTPGLYVLSVTITDNHGSTVTAAPSNGNLNVTVTDAPLYGTGNQLLVFQNEPFTDTVAQFYDGDPYTTAGDFSATISWGDGSAPDSNTTIVPATGGGFYVEGSHTYSAAGAYTPTITITDIFDGNNTPVNGTITVDQPPPSLAPDPGGC